MDEEGEGAVLSFYLGVWDTGLEIEDGVGVELELFEDAVDFGVLGLGLALGGGGTGRSIYFVEFFLFLCESVEGIGLLFRFRLVFQRFIGSHYEAAGVGFNAVSIG